VAQAVTEALPKESRDELTRRVVFRDYLEAAMNAVRRFTGREVLVYSPSEIAVRELREARMAFNVAKDGTVTVTATAFSPRIAVDLANTYVEILLARSSSVMRQQARETRDLLENLLAQARGTQAEAEEALRKFQAQHGASIRVPDEMRVDVTRLAQMETALADLQINREIAQKRLAFLKGEPKSPVAPVVDPAVQAARARLDQVEAKLATLTEKYTERHPLVQTTRVEIEEVQGRLRALLQPHQTPKPAGAPALQPVESAQLAKQMADLEVEIMTAQAREQSLHQRIASVKKSLASMGAREQELSSLGRAAETYRNAVAMLSDKLMGARVGEQSQIRGIQVVDTASLPRSPSPRQPLKILALGIAAGLGLGFATGLLLEYRAQVLETEEEVQSATGLPILGSIPIATRPVAPSGPIIFGEGDALPADSCRAIRIALQAQDLDRPLRTLLVSSPGVHEGKSTVVLNLARALLETKRRLLLIDADLRRPSLHAALGVPNEAGLAEMLRDGAEEWSGGFREVVPGLDFLPAGTRAGQPGALLGSPNMARVVAQARERSDLVIIDSPPILAVSDSLPLTALVDGIVLVVQSGVTQRGDLLRARTQLQKVGATVLGVVVNGLSPRDTRLYYSAYRAYVGAKTARRNRRRL
jgi:capsular exopolysaccharide synthesis family protein